MPPQRAFGTWGLVLELVEHPWMMSYGRPGRFGAVSDPSMGLAQVLRQFPEWPTIYAAAVAFNLHRPGQPISATVLAITSALLERYHGDQLQVRQLSMSDVATSLQKGEVGPEVTATPPSPPSPITTVGESAATEDADLTDREPSILETMLEHEITSERRRKTRADVVQLINRTHNAQSYNRAFSRLSKRNYLQSREGFGGGVWLTAQGKAEAQRLRSSD